MLKIKFHKKALTHMMLALAACVAIVANAMAPKSLTPIKVSAAANKPDAAVVLLIGNSQGIHLAEWTPQWTAMKTAAVAMVDSFPSNVDISFGVVFAFISPRTVSFSNGQYLTSNKNEVISAIQNVVLGEDEFRSRQNLYSGIIKSQEILDTYKGTGPKNIVLISDGSANALPPGYPGLSGTVTADAVEAVLQNGINFFIAGYGIFGLGLFYTRLFSLLDDDKRAYEIFSSAPQSQFDLRLSAVTKSFAAIITSDAITAATYTVTFVDWNGDELEIQPVVRGNSAMAPANPTRLGHTFTSWDISFANITANTTVTAQYQINTYTVTFVDWNGVVLTTEMVNHGSGATAPANPARIGHTFAGWSTNFSDITANTTVTAQYQINTYTVTFVDWDGTALGTETVDHGADATAPANPTRTGFTFIGWDTSLANITANTTVTAQYQINTYTVTFVDWDGTTLKTEMVDHGADATAPTNPTRTGFTFIGWSTNFSNITGNTTVTAQYQINTYTVTFVNWDGTALRTEIVNHGANATAPANPTRIGFTFIGWDTTFANITANTMVTAQYKADFAGASVTAFVTRLNGNQNDLTITITEMYFDGTTIEITQTFRIANNSANTYRIGEYSVYVDTKGNIQIREIYIV